MWVGVLMCYKIVIACVGIALVVEQCCGSIVMCDHCYVEGNSEDAVVGC